MEGMRIVAFSIEHFKSIQKLSMPEEGELGSLCCLVGANGAGKTTVLQALDFIAAMFDADRIRGWLKERGWERSELTPAGSKSPLMWLSVTARLGEDRLRWVGFFNKSKELWRCTKEIVTCNDNEYIFDLVDGKIRILGTRGGLYRGLDFDYNGSVLSSIKLNKEIWGDYLSIIESFVNFMRSIKSLELLSPHLIKQRAREGESLGLGGERLSAYIYRLGEEQRARLLEKFKLFYPQVVDLKTGAKQGGWKRLAIVETRGSATIELDARHASDGMLRVLTMLTELLCSPHPVVLLDEVENGLYPELLQPLIQTLCDAGKQVFITTHSPLLLNWMPADVARRDVFFVYRDARQRLAARRFTSLPAVQDALAVLGPGEAFADVSLARLEQDARAMEQPS
jgi:predicted ATPase